MKPEALHVHCINTGGIGPEIGGYRSLIRLGQYGVHSTCSLVGEGFTSSQVY